MKKKLIAFLFAVAVCLTTSVVHAALTTTNPYGGIWTQGIEGNYVKSEFLHNTYIHGSTAVGVTKSFSGWQSPGVWARTQSVKSNFGGNKTYYSFPDGTDL